MSGGESENRFNLTNIVVILVVLGALGFAIGIYVNGAGSESLLPENKNQLGVFGDFLGGFLNPILTFCTILLLISSIKYQTDELKLSRQELEETRRELARQAEESAKQAEESRKNNEIQLKIAELNHASLIMPDIRSNIKILVDSVREFSEKYYLGMEYSDGKAYLEIFTNMNKDQRNELKNSFFAVYRKLDDFPSVDYLPQSQVLTEKLTNLDSDVIDLNCHIKEYLEMGGSGIYTRKVLIDCLRHLEIPIEINEDINLRAKYMKELLKELTPMHPEEQVTEEPEVTTS